MSGSAIPVFVNRAGGAAAVAGDELADRIAAAFAEAGATAEVHLLAPDKIAGAVGKAARTAGRLVVGGGDGTMGCVAQALADHRDVELAILPLGTLNHFARDLGIPMALEEAAALAASGTALPVDVATVNDHRFVNNASIGLYPFMVRRRDDARERGLPKWLATLPAAWAALSRLPHHRLRIDMGEAGRNGSGIAQHRRRPGGRERVRPLITSLLFVGNNRYALEAGSVGTRESLTDGLLSIFAVAHRTRIGLLWFATRALFGRADRQADFVAIGEPPELTVHSSGRSIEIALDGEVRRLRSPLKFAVLPGALNIVARGSR
jgi:diacylglycerol kinase family enzyme